MSVKYESGKYYLISADGRKTLIAENDLQWGRLMWAALCRGSAKNGNQAGGGEKEWTNIATL